MLLRGLYNLYTYDIPVPGPHIGSGKTEEDVNWLFSPRHLSIGFSLVSSSSSLGVNNTPYVAQPPWKLCVSLYEYIPASVCDYVWGWGESVCLCLVKTVETSLRDTLPQLCPLSTNSGTWEQVHTRASIFICVCVCVCVCVFSDILSILPLASLYSSQILLMTTRPSCSSLPPEREGDTQMNCQTSPWRLFIK